MSTERLLPYLELSDAVVITDREHRLLHVNETFTHISGYSREEAVGRRAGFFKSQLTRPEMYGSMKEAIGSGRAWSGILINRKKSGDLWHSSLSITPFHVGTDVYYVGVFRELEGLEEGAYIGESRKIKLQSSLLRVLAVSSEFRDPEIEGHLRRVQRLTEELILAHDRRLGLGLPMSYIQNVVGASILHDIGKAEVPDQILRKPGKLTAEERTIIETHPQLGTELLSRFRETLDDELWFSQFAAARNIVLYHHEKWDGTGYPYRLKGRQIPLEARVVAVVDVYDALTSRRPYKEAWNPERAGRYLTEHSGSHFDPELVESFAGIGR